MDSRTEIDNLGIDFFKERTELSFAKLHNKLHKYLYNSIIRYKLDKENKLFIVNEALSIIYFKIDTHNPSYRFTNWCCAIVNNEAKRFIFKQKSMLRVDSMYDEQNYNDIDEEKFELLRNKLLSTIQFMDPRYRDVFIDYYINNMTSNEVCEKYHMHNSTRKRFTNKGMNWLRKQFLKRYESPFLK